MSCKFSNDDGTCQLAEDGIERPIDEDGKCQCDDDPDPRDQCEDYEET